ncbi:hypothetical protein GGI15_003816 [Coemansia interrupta]|uniref:Uncharacterized protein n=1 Tax=Coemansia interrupta TaxID=1126814 RepID=A0A9W8LGK8_9FUNG|nr:hypothetical protein GGI15_003816 [Coemansia interrupta]
MNPNYRFPSPAGTNQGFTERRHSTMTNVPINPRPVEEQHTFSSSNIARYSFAASVDIPRRRSSLRNERVIQPEARSAGIGGFQTFYRRSGIGNNVRDDRDSGIGKICVEDASSSSSFSSMRRRLSGRRRMSEMSVESVGSSSAGEEGVLAARATENFARMQRRKRGQQQQEREERGREQKHGHLFRLFHPHGKEER